MTKYYLQKRTESPPPDKPADPNDLDNSADPRPLDPDPSPGDPIVDPADEPML